MPKKGQKKDAIQVNLNMDRKTAERLFTYAEEMGQSKVKAVERIINAYLDEIDDLSEGKKAVYSNRET